MESVIGDFNYASSLVDTPHSALHSVTHIINTPLPFTYIGNCKEAIETTLRDELGIYDVELKGVPVAFNEKTAKFKEKYGEMLAAQPFIHCKIQCEFIIFCPKVDDVLEGVVNKVTSKVIGCLIHGCFYASIHQDASSVRKLAGVKIGDKVKLRVTKLEEDGNGVLSITGEICTIEPNRNKHTFENDSGIEIVSNKGSVEESHHNDDISMTDVVTRVESDVFQLPVSIQPQIETNINGSILINGGDSSDDNVTLGNSPSTEKLRKKNKKAKKKRKKKHKHSIDIKDVGPKEKILSTEDPCEDDTIMQATSNTDEEVGDQKFESLKNWLNSSEQKHDSSILESHVIAKALDFDMTKENGVTTEEESKDISLHQNTVSTDPSKKKKQKKKKHEVKIKKNKHTNKPDPLVVSVSTPTAASPASKSGTEKKATKRKAKKPEDETSDNSKAPVTASDSKDEDQPKSKIQKTTSTNSCADGEQHHANNGADPTDHNKKKKQKKKKHEVKIEESKPTDKPEPLVVVSTPTAASPANKSVTTKKATKRKGKTPEDETSDNSKAPVTTSNAKDDDQPKSKVQKKTSTNSCADGKQRHVKNRAAYSSMSSIEETISRVIQEYSGKDITEGTETPDKHEPINTGVTGSIVPTPSLKSPQTVPKKKSKDLTAGQSFDAGSSGSILESSSLVSHEMFSEKQLEHHRLAIFHLAKLGITVPQMPAALGTPASSQSSLGDIMSPLVNNRRDVEQLDIDDKSSACHVTSTDDNACNGTVSSPNLLHTGNEIKSKSPKKKKKKNKEKSCSTNNTADATLEEPLSTLPKDESLTPKKKSKKKKVRK